MTNESRAKLIGSSVKRAAQVVGGEALQGVLHYTLNILLIRQMSPNEYGVFSIAFICAGITISYLNAFAATSLQVHLNRKEHRQSVVDSTLAAVAAIFTAATFLCIVIVGLGLKIPFLISVTCAALAASWAIRQYVKARCFAYHKTRFSLAIDVSYFVLGAILIGFQILRSREDAAGFILALCVANIAASGIGTWLIGPRTVRWGDFDFSFYRGIGREVAWTVLGNTATTIQGYAYALLIGLRLGPASVAILSAGLAIFGPVRILVGAWQNSARTEFSADFVRGDTHRVRLVASFSMIAISLCGLTLAVSFILLWDSIYRHILFQYRESDIRWVVWGWMLATVLFALRAVPSVVLQSARDFRRITISTMWGATLSLGLTTWACSVNVILVPYGVAAAELLCLVDQYIVYRRISRG